MTEKILGNLPGHNCGACGYPRCDGFAAAVAAGKATVSGCLVLSQERYRGNLARIRALIPASAETAPSGATEAIAAPVGLIDGYEADFILAPFRGEAACREILHALTPGAVGAGDVIRYRPLGCPIAHFARILEVRDGLFTVHVVGPRHRLGDEEFSYTDIGLCMVMGFEGDVKGKPPEVGRTVRFIPEECMMQKVHSGVVVKCEGRTVRLEGIDLKVWAPAVAAQKPGA
jgi:uncharacterized Fe-S cluster-containing protein